MRIMREAELRRLVMRWMPLARVDAAMAMEKYLRGGILGAFGEGWRGCCGGFCLIVQ
jgi:hypothetical protein